MRTLCEAGLDHVGRTIPMYSVPCYRPSHDRGLVRSDRHRSMARHSLAFAFIFSVVLCSRLISAAWMVSIQSTGGARGTSNKTKLAWGTSVSTGVSLLLLSPSLFDGSCMDPMELHHMLKLLLLSCMLTFCRREGPHQYEPHGCPRRRGKQAYLRGHHGA